MIPELKVLGEIKEPKRIRIQDVTEKRLDSLREAVIDFCKRGKSIVQPMNGWAYISRILKGQEEADLWWALDGDRVDGFIVSKVAQDFDGQWTAYIHFGWSGGKQGKEYFKTVLDDYFKKGISRIQFVTRRHAKVFKRWAGTGWEPVATTFELRR